MGHHPANPLYRRPRCGGAGGRLASGLVVLAPAAGTVVTLLPVFLLLPPFLLPAPLPTSSVSSHSPAYCRSPSGTRCKACSAPASRLAGSWDCKAPRSWLASLQWRARSRQASSPCRGWQASPLCFASCSARATARRRSRRGLGAAAACCCCCAPDNGLAGSSQRIPRARLVAGCARQAAPCFSLAHRRAAGWIKRVPPAV